MHHLTTESVDGVRAAAPARPAEAGRARAAEAARRTSSPRIAAIIVTWNRRAAVDQVLEALSRQTFPLGRLNVVVVDNGSSDGTAEQVISRWRPDLVVDNPTSQAHEPDFRVQHGCPGAADAERGRYSAAQATDENALNTAGFASLSLIRNTQNHGGCGGFNTGFAFLEQFLDSDTLPLDYAWLVDDDVDLPPDALVHLTQAAESDPQIGLVGSRTVDFDRRDTTTETTIYFDNEQGTMGPDPAPGHPMYEEHTRWVEEVGDTRGAIPFKGVRDVDICSACSLLARWSAVKHVGFWDHRYFIYCDDADWCLRFTRAGYRVVCNLDAVVYHTYWMAKLTPARAYYSQRNLLWVIEKSLGGLRLKRALLRRLGSVLKHSFKTMLHCRLFHAEILRRTAHDAITGRGGRLADDGPEAVPVMSALEQAGALAVHGRILVMCSHPEAIQWADDLRALVMHELIARGMPEAQPRWIYMVRSDVPDPRDAPGGTSASAALPDRVVYEPNRKSKWHAQRDLLRRPPTAVVVFDQSCDFPLLRSPFNIHIDLRHPGMARPEQDGLAIRARMVLRIMLTGMLCLLYTAAARRRTHVGKYG